MWGVMVEDVLAVCRLTAMIMKLKSDQMMKNSGLLLLNTTSNAMGSLVRGEGMGGGRDDVRTARVCSLTQEQQ